jgi:hypothetical protein
MEGVLHGVERLASILIDQISTSKSKKKCEKSYINKNAFYKTSLVGVL